MYNHATRILIGPLQSHDLQYRMLLSQHPKYLLSDISSISDFPSKAENFIVYICLMLILFKISKKLEIKRFYYNNTK